MKLKDAKKLYNTFKQNLNEISKVKFKWKEQKGILKDIELLYKSQKAVIKIFNDNSSVTSEAKYKLKYGSGLNIVTPKQMLQRLPIALAQVKEGNEIRQITYSLYRAKEITKKMLWRIQ